MSGRCEECGSWERECVADEPVEGCGCMRCAAATITRLRVALEEVRALTAAMKGYPRRPTEKRVNDIARAALEGGRR